MAKQQKTRTAEEKERIIQEIQKIGVVAGCRKYNIYASMYYDWLERYEASGIKGLEDRRKAPTPDTLVKKYEKEIRLLKELVAEKDLTIRLQDELIKKKNSEWKRKGK